MKQNPKFTCFLWLNIEPTSFMKSSGVIEHSLPQITSWSELGVISVIPSTLRLRTKAFKFCSHFTITSSSAAWDDRLDDAPATPIQNVVSILSSFGAAAICKEACCIFTLNMSTIMMSMSQTLVVI